MTSVTKISYKITSKPACNGIHNWPSCSKIFFIYLHLQPHTEQNSRTGPEPLSVEADVYILLVAHARKEELTSILTWWSWVSQSPNVLHPPPVLQKIFGGQVAQVFTGQMFFLLPNQRCQCTERDIKYWPKPVTWLHCFFVFYSTLVPSNVILLLLWNIFLLSPLHRSEQQ